MAFDDYFNFGIFSSTGKDCWSSYDYKSDAFNFNTDFNNISVFFDNRNFCSLPISGSIWNNAFFNIGTAWCGTKSAKSEPKPKSETKTKSTSERVAAGAATYGKYAKSWGIGETELPNGTKVNACRWSKFERCQPEWIELQKFMIQAAEELGLELVYSDVERTVSQSNAGHKKKGDLVLKGGSSPHNYGCAADIKLFKDGTLVGDNSSTMKEFADRVRELSNDKIEWGGEWRKKGERHHFQLRNWQEKYKKREYLIR